MLTRRFSTAPQSWLAMASKTPIASTSHLQLRHSSSAYTSKPGPPSLPPAQQREFDELVRRVQTPAARPAATSDATGQDSQAAAVDLDELVMHPDFRAKPKPKFEGEVNPVTGEVGGPKHEPLAHGDWEYGGRCTDF